MTSEQLLLVQVTNGLNVLLTAAATPEALTALAAIQAAQVTLQAWFDEVANPPEVAVLDPDLPVDAEGVTPEISVVDERVRGRNRHARHSDATHGPGMGDPEVVEPPTQLEWVGEAALNGSGLVLTAEEILHRPDGRATIHAVGLITANASATKNATIVLQGVGAVDAFDVTELRRATATLSGHGSVAVWLPTAFAASAAIGASGSVDATAVTEFRASATISGVGLVRGSAITIRLGELEAAAAIEGAGLIEASTIADLVASSGIQGVGLLEATGHLP